MIWALAWNPEDGIIDVDSEGRYADKLTEWLNSYSRSNFYYTEGGNNNYAVSDGENTEDLQFNEMQDDVEPMPAMWQNGAETLFWRTVTAGGETNEYIVDGNGYPITSDFGGQEDCVWTREVIDGIEYAYPRLGIALRNAAIQACGGSLHLDVWWSNYNDSCGVIVYNGFCVTVDAEGLVTSGTFNEWHG